jgi:hypothetical protein
MVHDGTVHNMFQQFTADASEGDMPIVFYITFVCFFEYWDYVRCFPIVWNGAGIN